MSPFDRLRKICLAFHGAEERESWGHPVFFVRNKCFAAWEPKEGRGAIAVRIDPLDAGIFAEDQRFFPTPYGRGKWISMWAEGEIDWKLVAQLVERSYAITTAKRR